MWHAKSGLWVYEDKRRNRRQSRPSDEMRRNKNLPGNYQLPGREFFEGRGAPANPLQSAQSIINLFYQ